MSQPPAQLYRTLSLIRAVEEKIVEVYASDIIQQPVHLSVGQEAVAVALCVNLTDEDFKIGTHRNHALYLSAGGDVTAFFAELLGKPSGFAGGMAGSMHACAPEVGILGCSSIVAGSIPIAVGMAEACKPGQIVACLFGDGACDEGVFYESLNWAALRGLPVLFVCENNGLAVETTLPDRRANSLGLDAVAESLGVTARYTVGRDVFALNEFLKYHTDKIRGGGGPRFVEAFVTRAYAHNGTEKQIELCNDPLHIAREQVPDWQSIDKGVHEEVERGWKEACDV